MRFKNQTAGLFQTPKFGRYFSSAFHLAGLLALMFASSSLADQLQGVSVRDASVPVPAGGNAPSSSPQITPDGRFVLFTSSASDLVTNASGMFVCNLFLRDRASNTTTLVSVNLNSTSGNDDSAFGQVSTNGRYVAFQSDASDLVAGDTNKVSDIFVRDMQVGSNILVSVAADGGFANGPSTAPAMTPDGRYVVFVSAATNLVANDTNGFMDIFVRDLVNGTTTCVTTGAVKAARNFTVSSPLKASESPAISADGRYVAFYSTNDFGNGVPFTGSPYYSVGEVYVRDLVANTTIWASSNAVAMAYTNLGGSKYPFSSHPVISENGQFVAFKTSYADRTGPTAIFRLDLNSGGLVMLTTNSLPAGNGIRQALVDDWYGPEMTPDGRLIAFGNREYGTNNSSLSVWDASTGAALAISTNLNGSIQTNADALAPTLSRDGRFIAFVSNATNLVGNAIADGYHVYVHDLLAGTNQLVDVDTHGIGSTDSLGVVPAVSADGRYLAIATEDGAFVDGDNNNALDVFVRDTVGATTELVSQRSPALLQATGNGLSSLAAFSMSAAGRRAVFTSYASDLTTNDFNRNRDVFVADLQSGTNMLVSVGLDGNSGLGGASGSPVISADGHFVAFVSAATNLVVNDTNGAADIFLRDLDAGITTMVSVNTNGTPLGTGDASLSAISQDGRYVVFLCKSAPSAAYPGTYWRDTVANQTVLINGNSSPTNPPSISADGQRVLWFSTTPRLNIWNAPTLATIYTYITAVSSAVLSPTGTRVLYQAPSAKQMVVYNVIGGTNLFSCTNLLAIKNSAVWSRDERYITFATSAPLVANDNNGTNDVYLCDLQNNIVSLISANSAWTASANGISDSPTISSDGRFIAFRSFATDLLPAATNSPSLFIFDRTTGSNAALATAAANGWTFLASTPVLSSNGNSIVFQSWNLAAATNDLNRIQDVFSSAQDSIIADSDGDGIPDWWMMKYFGHATGREADLSRSADDADGDGISNLQEYQTGTDPTNPNSVLALQISTITNPGNTTTLTWPAVPGKSYQVQYRDDLNNVTWLNYTGSVVIVGRQGSITVPATQSSRFYRAVCLY